MDAKNIYVGIDGLRAIADAAFRLTFAFSKDARVMRTEIRKVADEMQEIAGMLHRLSLLASTLDDDKTIVEGLQIVPSQLISCHQTLASLERSLLRKKAGADATKKATNSHGLKWPFTTAWTTDLLRDLGEHKDTIKRALSANSMVDLLQSVSNERFAMGVNSEGRISEHINAPARIAALPGFHNVINYFLKFDQNSDLERELKTRHSIYGSEFLESQAFNDWLQCKSPMLWLTAPAGAGKTVFAGEMIGQTIKRRPQDTAVAFVFCTFSDPRTHSPANVLSTIVAQVARQNQAAWCLLNEYYQELHLQKRTVKSPTVDNITALLLKISTLFKHVLVIVDGVNECGNKPGGVTESLVSLMEQTETKLSLALISRDRQNTGSTLRKDFHQIDITPSEDELRLFTATELEKRILSGDLNFTDPQVKDEVIQKLSLGRDATFRRISCQLDYLCALTSPEKQTEFLAGLPCTLETTYKLVLDNFNKKDQASQSLISASLQLVAFSNPPLTTQELCQALSVAGIVGLEVEMLEYPEVDEAEILDQCGIFLRRSEKDERLEFSHFTVKEFLSSLSPSGPDYASYYVSDARTNHRLSLCALRFLCLKNFSRLPAVYISEEEFIQNRSYRYPFYRFAALTWPKLAADQRDDPDILMEAMELFDPKQTPNFKSWCLEFCRHYRIHGSWHTWRLERDEAMARAQRDFRQSSNSSVCSESTKISSESSDDLVESSEDDSSELETTRGHNGPRRTNGFLKWRRYAHQPPWLAGQTRRLARITRRGDFTPLHMAALVDMDTICRELLDGGANVNQLSMLGSPLQCALGGTFLLACHDLSTHNHSDDWTERPSRRAVELFIKSGADCTRPLPNKMYSWATIGALSLKASEWAQDYSLFALVVKGGAQMHDDDIAVFRALCRKWARDKHQHLLSSIMSILEYLTEMVAKGEGESSAYLKAFQKVVTETTDIDMKIPVSGGVSDEMLVAQMWQAIESDGVRALEERCQDTRCRQLLRGDTLTRLLDFAVTCSSVSCLDYLLTTYVDSDEKDTRKGKMVLDCVDERLEDILLCLLKHGANTTETDHQGNTIWHLSAKEITATRALNTLISHTDRVECEKALCAVNRDGRTALAEALINKCYGSVSTIVTHFQGNHEIFKSDTPPPVLIISRVESVDILRQIHASGIIRVSSVESPLNHLDWSANIEVVRQLLLMYPYERSESGESPLKCYLKATHLQSYDKDVMTELVTADLAQDSDKTHHTIWEFVCTKLRNLYKRQPGTEAAVDLIKLLIDLGCLAAYEEGTGNSGLKEMEALFSYQNLPPGMHTNGDIVPVLEDIFVLVFDSTNKPSYINHSGLDVKIIKWAILYDSLFLIDRLLKTGVDVHKRENETNAMEFLCSHGSGPTGYRIFARFLEKTGMEELDELTPSGEGVSLLHRLGLVDGWSMTNFVYPSFRSAEVPASSHLLRRPPQPPPMGYHRIGPEGFAQFRRPMSNPKFSLVQRLLWEGANAQVVSSTTQVSPMNTHLSAGYVDSARLLLRHGGHQTLHIADIYGWTPTAWACAHGYTDFLDEMAASSCPEPIWRFRAKVCLSKWGFPRRIFDEASALHLATIASAETVAFLLNRGFVTDLDVVTTDGSTPLHFATTFGQQNTIKLLLSRGANINAQNNQGFTPLHLSIIHQDETTTSTLLELGAAHLKAGNGDTPLDMAIKRRSKSIEDMINRSIGKAPQSSTADEPNHLHGHWLTAVSRVIERAIDEGDHETCQRLLNNGCPCDIKMRSCHTCTALLFALSRNDFSTAIVESLIERGASFRGVTCGRHSCGFYSSYGVRHFSDDDSDTSSIGSTTDSEDERAKPWPVAGSTALDLLMWEKDLAEKISAWLRLIPERDMLWLLDNSIAVHVAIDRGSLKALETLFSYVSELEKRTGRKLIRNLVNKVPTRGTTNHRFPPLHDAANEENVGIAELLIKHGAEVNQTSRGKQTPLHIAASSNDLAMAKLLLDHGASIDVREERGYTPLEVAIKEVSSEMVQFLIDRGARVEDHRDSGRAFTFESTKMASLLLKAGVKFNQAGCFGVPQWAPALFDRQLATFILNSDFSHEITARIPKSTIWKVIWVFHVIDGSTSMHRSLRLLYLRLGSDFMRQITEFEGEELGDDQFSLLCFASQHGLIEEVRVLLKMGCDVEFEGSVAGTALMNAAHEGRMEVLKTLVLWGARIQYEKDGHWKSAVAEAERFPDIVNWLLVGRFMEQAKIEAPSDDWDNCSQLCVRPWSGIRLGVFVLEGKYARGWGDSMLRWLSCLEKAKRNFRGKVVVSRLWEIDIPSDD